MLSQDNCLPIAYKCPGFTVLFVPEKYCGGFKVVFIWGQEATSTSASFSRPLLRKPGSPPPPGASALGTTAPLELGKGRDVFWASQVALVVKNLPANVRDIRDAGSIPGLGRSPGEENGNPLQYSCQVNPMDRGAWRATVHRAAKSWTQLNDLAHVHRDVF